MANTSTISAGDFTARIQSEERCVVIDVRTAAEVNSECLDGCLNVPLQELEDVSFKAALQQQGYEQGNPVYLVCGTGLRATKAFEQLAGSCDLPLLVVEGGINALKQTGVTLKQGSSSVISLERQVRIAAGSLVILGVVLGATLSPMLYGLSAFVGAGLVFAGVTDTCGMAMLLARMPWNRAG